MKTWVIKFLGLAAFGGLCLLSSTVKAQINMATVVSSCGTPPSTYVAGFPYPVTQDTTGGLCAGSTGGGGITQSHNQVFVGAAWQNWAGVLNGSVYAGLIDWSTSSQAHTDLTSPIPTQAATVPIGGVGAEGFTASGTNYTENPLPGGCRAATGAPTAVTDGQKVAAECGVEGKQVILPYSIKETAVRGSTGATTSNTQVSIIASAGGSLKNYITSIQCSNSGATTSILTFTDAATTILINPAGGGTNVTFPVPLVTAAATAFQVTFGSASTSQYCSAQGYTGP